MNKYETVFIMKSDITEENKKEVISRIENYINSNGTITKIEELGTKKLAYGIKNQKEGYYCIMEFEEKKEIIPGLERLYRITDEILKFITIRKED